MERWHGNLERSYEGSNFSSQEDLDFALQAYCSYDVLLLPINQSIKYIISVHDPGYNIIH